MMTKLLIPLANKIKSIGIENGCNRGTGIYEIYDDVDGANEDIQTYVIEVKNGIDENL